MPSWSSGSVARSAARHQPESCVEGRVAASERTADIRDCRRVARAASYRAAGSIVSGNDSCRTCRPGQPRRPRSKPSGMRRAAGPRRRSGHERTNDNCNESSPRTNYRQMGRTAGAGITSVESDGAWPRQRIRARGRRTTRPQSGSASSTRRSPSARASSSRRSPGSRTSRSTRPTTSRSTTSATSAIPGVYPFTRGVYPSMYRGKLWTMRQFAGFGGGGGDERPLPLPARARPDRALDGVRHADADGLRLGPRALARRGRARRGRDRLARRHGDALRGHSARRGLDVDDDQLAGGDAARVLSSASARSRACRARSCAGRSRRTSSRSTSRRRNGSSRRSRRCGSSST